MGGDDSFSEADSLDVVILKDLSPFLSERTRSTGLAI